MRTCSSKVLVVLLSAFPLVGLGDPIPAYFESDPEAKTRAACATAQSAEPIEVEVTGARYVATLCGFEQASVVMFDDLCSYEGTGFLGLGIFKATHEYDCPGILFEATTGDRGNSPRVNRSSTFKT